MSKAKVAVVLGGTRGIGFALTKALAQALGPDGMVYLTARQSGDGREAVAKLREQGIRVAYLIFDLSHPLAPATVAQIFQEHHGGIDIVVQNGAYMPQPNMPAIFEARPMIAANSHGTLNVLSAFLPILRENGRIVVVASRLGVLSNLSDQIRARFEAEGTDTAGINRLMDEYVRVAEDGAAVAKGWPEWSNVASKVGQVALVRAFAQWAKSSGKLPKGALINAACPGLTLTDGVRGFMDTIFKDMPAQTPDEAAVDLAWLALLPPGTTAPYGELVSHKEIVPFDARAEESKAE
jgi:NAD(P)-dependent dehydrogenase (short-subunit alcohol dehydrogenase family)